MELREGALLEDHLFGAVVNDVRRLLDLSYKQMALKVGIDAERLRHFKTKGTKVTRTEFRDKIVSLIGESNNNALIAYLECKFPTIFGGNFDIPLPAGVALAQWMEAQDQSNTTFYRECVRRPGGRFLLMRRDDEGKLICALMRVNSLVERGSLPSFNTIRYMSDGQKRRTNGFIFEFHGRVYAIGKLDGLQGLRFSNLYIHQHLDRSDLFGIRLGILRGTSKGSGHTFASRLYAYQIQTSARPVSGSPGILKRILKPWHPEEDPHLARSISGFKSIYAMLEPGPLLDNGITAPA